MPRRDGFDTNQEMLADFQAGAHGVFVTAYERTFEDASPDTYKACLGKPLDAISLVVQCDTKQDGFTRQTLNISALTSYHVEGMRDHLTMRNRPEDVHEHYASIASRLGGATVSTDLNIRQLVPVEGIVADFTAYLSEEGPTRHVGTMKEKPAKLSLALGKTFVDDAAEYANSSEFRISNELGPKLARLYSDTTHAFRIEMRADIWPSLNGSESRRWLSEYANRMLGSTTLRGARLARLIALDAPESVIATEQKNHDLALAAWKRAEELLSNK